MSTHARHAVSADRIDAWLPQTQCTQCGYPRCRAYAEAVAHGEAGINQCPPGGEVTIAALAKLLNVPAEPLNPRFGMHKPRARAVIDEAVCIGCRKCLDVCPVDAIVGARKLMHTVIADECNGCELCLPPCPVDCIAMQAIDAAPDSQPWPEYTRAEADRWRARTENRLRRLAQRKHARGNSHLSDTAPAFDRERIRAEIRAAVERVKTKRKIRQDLQGEAGLSPMPLTGIGAAERPHTDVRAGVNRSPGGDAREGVPAVPGAAAKTSTHSAPPIPGGALAGTKTR